MDDNSERTIVGTEPARSTDSEATLRDSRQRFHAGDVILGQYEVLEELGQGGMGVVYRCMDRVSGTEVAVKALPPELSHSADSMEDIRDNFQLVHSLIHQNIAACLTLAKDSRTGDYYLVMEMVAGKSLSLWIRERRREGSLSLEAALPILRQVALALDFAHGERVMHRDIKPGNIMVCKDGKVKVLDFGIAAQIRSTMSRISMAFMEQSGTRQYKAPEQWRSRPQGAATDQYALAVTAYEMLSGRLPFDDDDPAVLREMVLKEQPLPIEGLPDGANSALRRALAKKPEERFASCSDFVKALGGEEKSGGSVKRRERAEPSGEEALIDELLKTKVRIKRIREALDGGKLDRGQTFGEHLDEFRDKCDAGDAAFENRLYSNARRFYDAALAAQSWIKENTPLREKAFSAMAEARSAREKALGDKNDVRTWASSQYDEAESALHAAERSYEAGSFAEATGLSKSAAQCFGNAMQAARKEHLRGLEESMQEAAKSGKKADWMRVLELSNEMKALDAVAAKKWRDKAYSNLISVKYSNLISVKTVAIWVFSLVVYLILIAAAILETSKSSTSGKTGASQNNPRSKNKVGKVLKEKNKVLKVLNADNVSHFTPPFRQIALPGTASAKVLEILDNAGKPPEGKVPSMEYGGAVFQVDIPTTGTYKIWLNVWWEGSCGNTLNVQVGYERKSITVGNDSKYNQWHWVEVPRQYQLAQGPCGIAILNREDGIKLDQILVTSDLSYVPQGRE